MSATLEGHTQVANDLVAERLDEVAQLLEEQRANPFRVQAYRNAARTLRELDRPVGEILEEQGIDGLDRLPSIGPALARAISQLVTSGRFGLLDRLRGEHDPVAVLASVPGVGKTLARRLHDELDIDTLEALEIAAHDGSLERVPGFGEKRITGIRDALATRLGWSRRGRASASQASPDVAELLDVDREYRSRAAAGELPRIAPRRFNPTRIAWLPVLHTVRQDRHYTALFSNTARAHSLGRTRDWVVLYHDGGSGEHQSTVVTAALGPLAGKRVVRGREGECLAHYDSHRRRHV
jgi:DNA polymerase (family X)